MKNFGGTFFNKVPPNPSNFAFPGSAWERVFVRLCLTISSRNLQCEHTMGSGQSPEEMRFQTDPKNEDEKQGLACEWKAVTDLPIHVLDGLYQVSQFLMFILANGYDLESGKNFLRVIRRLYPSALRFQSERFELEKSIRFHEKCFHFVNLSP